MTEENLQAKWNVAGETVRLIADIRRLAAEYTLGLQPKKFENEIVHPNPRKAYACWVHIGMLISNRLSLPQKQEIRRLAFELERDTVTLNPNYKNPKDRHGREPKYLQATNWWFGIRSQKYNKYIDWLIKEVGMGIGDRDPDEGYL